MNTVELFAGIGGFRVAADEYGLTTVFANDIDKNAAKVYKSVWGDDSLTEGDIHDYLDSIPNHDVLTGGFPCQPFSKAGKKQGIDDFRGTLFESIVYIVDHKKPNYFILENVNSLLYMKNGRHFRTILSALSDLGYKIEWRVFNAEQFGLPQHRQRVIIVGTKHMNPEDSYFLEKEDEEKLSTNTLNAIASYTLWGEIEKSKNFSDWGMAFSGKYVSAPIIEKQYAPHRLLTEVLQDETDESFDFTADTLERIKNSEYVNKHYNGVQILYNQSGGARMGYSIFGPEGVSPTLTASTSRHYERYKIGDRYRRLTNIEYARIQGFSDHHCKALTPYNQYKYYGNAVPPQIISHVFDVVLNGKYRTLEKATKTIFDFMR